MLVRPSLRLDPVVDLACVQVSFSTNRNEHLLHVESFPHAESGTISYVVHDRRTRAAAIIDSVLDLDVPAGRIATRSAQQLLDFVRRHDLELEWVLDTHVHADHLTAAAWLRDQTGARLGIGRRIDEVQGNFARMFNLDPKGRWIAEAFDDRFDDGHRFSLGSMSVTVLHLPGHTPACVGYLVEDALFTGDTIFMPDLGTARADFPGGDPVQLFHSIQRIYALPAQTRLFMCHDYPSEQRPQHQWQTTVAEQSENNIHVRRDSELTEFVAMRRSRDATLPVPRMMYPSVQINIRGGKLPNQEANGIAYLRIPIIA